MVWEFTLCENNNAGNNASDIWIENNFISKIFTSGSFLKALIDCNFSALDITEIHSITSYWTADMDSTWTKYMSGIFGRPWSDFWVKIEISLLESLFWKQAHEDFGLGSDTRLDHGQGAPDIWPSDVQP